MKKHNTRGGKRENSGRKKIPEELKIKNNSTTITILRSTKKELDKKEGKSYDKKIQNLIKQ